MLICTERCRAASPAALCGIQIRGSTRTRLHQTGEGFFLGFELPCAVMRVRRGRRLASRGYREMCKKMRASVYGENSSQSDQTGKYFSVHTNILCFHTFRKMLWGLSVAIAVKILSGLSSELRGHACAARALLSLYRRVRVSSSDLKRQPRLRIIRCV